jgi:hypothetical protein
LPRACPFNGEQATIKSAIYKRRDQKKFHNIINIYNKDDEEECEEVKEKIAKVVILHLENTMSIYRVDTILAQQLPSYHPSSAAVCPAK